MCYLRLSSLIALVLSDKRRATCNLQVLLALKRLPLHAWLRLPKSLPASIIGSIGPFVTMVLFTCAASLTTCTPHVPPCLAHAGCSQASLCGVDIVPSPDQVAVTGKLYRRAINGALGLTGSFGLQEVGIVPSGLPAFTPPFRHTLPLSRLKDVFVISFVMLAETLAMGKALALRAGQVSCIFTHDASNMKEQGPRTDTRRKGWAVTSAWHPHTW